MSFSGGTFRALVTAIAIVVSTLTFAADAAVDFSIREQPVNQALLEFARQANVSILFPAAAFDGINANPLSGSYTVGDGLDRLLRGTGVEASMSPESRQIVVQARVRPAAVEPDIDAGNEENSIAEDIERATVRLQDRLTLEEILVTAQRREEVLLETPVTVNAVVGGVIEQQNIRSLQSLAPLVPGMEIEPDGQRVTIRVRGLGTADGSPAAENIVALHVDGIYISHRNNLQGYFYDIAQVEMLQGPQGTLYGRNTAAGTINIRSARPVFSQEGFVEVEAGNYNHKRVAGMLNVPVGSDLAMRAAFQRSISDGYFASNIDESRDLYGRLGLLWEPGDRLSVYGKLDFGKAWRRGNGVALLGTVNNANPDNWQATWQDESEWFNDHFFHPTNSNVDEIEASRYTSNYRGVMTEIVYDLTPDTALIVNLARIRESTTNYTVDSDGEIGTVSGEGVWGGLPGARVQGRPWVEETADIRLQGRLAGQLDWTGGYFYWQDDTNEPGSDPGGLAYHAPVSRGDSYAYYGQFTWRPPAYDAIQLTLGARHTTDWKEWNSQVNMNDTVTVGGSNGTLSQEWENDDFKIGLAYDFSDTSMLYGNVSTGYRAGSWFPGPFPSYDPEYVDAYEVGWKGSLFDERMVLVFNTYFYELTGATVQFAAFNTLAGQNEFGYANLGDAQITGLNLNGHIVLTERDMLAFNFDYTDAEITEFDFESVEARLPPGYEQGGIFNWRGLQMPNTTPWRLTLAWNREFNTPAGVLDSRLQAVVNASRYFDYRETTNVQYEFEGYKIPTYATLDWNLMYRPAGAAWHAGIYIRNIFDERVINSVSGGDNAPDPGGTVGPGDVPNGDDSLLTGTLRAPRTFGVRLGFNF